MAKGGFINPQERSEIASKMALYSGLSEKSILQNNLDVPTAFFWKDLLREEGKTIGRLDSRYLGINSLIVKSSTSGSISVRSFCCNSGLSFL